MANDYLNEFRKKYPEFKNTNDDELAKDIFTVFYKGEGIKEDEYYNFIGHKITAENKNQENKNDSNTSQTDIKIENNQRTAIEAMSDTFNAMGSGVGNVIKGAGTISGLVTGNMDNPIIKFGSEMSEDFKNQYSPQKKEWDKTDKEKIEAQDNELNKAIQTLKNYANTPQNLVTDLAEQIPQLVTMLAGGKGAGAVSKVLGASEQVAKKIATSGAIVTEAGLSGADSGNDTYTSIIKLPDEIWNNSPEYQKLIQDGINPNKAKEAMALEEARYSAGITGALTFGLNKFIPRADMIEKAMVGDTSGLMSKGLSGKVAGAASETFVEGTDEAQSKINSNIGINNVNPNQDLFSGVGEATAKGAVLGGVTSTGIATIDSLSSLANEQNKKLDDATKGFAKLQEEIKTNNELPIEELLQKDLEVKKDEDIKPLDNNITAVELPQIDNNPLPVSTVEEISNTNTIDENENATVSTEPTQINNVDVIPQSDESNIFKPFEYIRKDGEKSIKVTDFGNMDKTKAIYDSYNQDEVELNFAGFKTSGKILPNEYQHLPDGYVTVLTKQGLLEDVNTDKIENQTLDLNTTPQSDNNPIPISTVEEISNTNTINENENATVSTEPTQINNVDVVPPVQSIDILSNNRFSKQLLNYADEKKDDAEYQTYVNDRLNNDKNLIDKYIDKIDKWDDNADISSQVQNYLVNELVNAKKENPTTNGIIYEPAQKELDIIKEIENDIGYTVDLSKKEITLKPLDNNITAVEEISNTNTIDENENATVSTEPTQINNVDVIPQSDESITQENKIDETQWHSIPDNIDVKISQGSNRANELTIKDLNKNDDPYIYQTAEFQGEQGVSNTINRRLATNEELTQKNKNRLVDEKYQHYFNDGTINEDGFLKTKKMSADEYKVFNDYLKSNNIGEYINKKTSKDGKIGFKINNSEVLNTFGTPKVEEAVSPTSEIQNQELAKPTLNDNSQWHEIYSMFNEQPNYVLNGSGNKRYIVEKGPDGIDANNKIVLDNAGKKDVIDFYNNITINQDTISTPKVEETVSPTPEINPVVNENLTSENQVENIAPQIDENETVITENDFEEWFKNNPIQKTTNINVLYRKAVDEYYSILDKGETNQKSNISKTLKSNFTNEEIDSYKKYNKLNKAEKIKADEEVKSNYKKIAVWLNKNQSLFTDNNYASKLQKAKDKMNKYQKQLDVKKIKSNSNSMYMKSNQSMEKDIINTLETDKTIFEERPYTKEEWNLLFPNNKINSPIGQIKLGENQFDKLNPDKPDKNNPQRKKQDRRGHLDYIYKTLIDPTFIVKKDNKYIFVKEFIRADDSTKRYSSIIVEKDGLKINISNYGMHLKQIINEIKNADEVINTVEVATNQATNSDSTPTLVEKKSIAKTNKISQDISYSKANNKSMPNNPKRLTGEKGARPTNGIVNLRGKEITLPDKFAPMTPATIRKQVIDIIGNRLYFSKIKNKAAGFYRKNNGETRIKDINNIEVYAHELAHYLDFYNGNKIFRNAYTNVDFKDEIESFSYTDNEDTISKEGFAEYVRAYLTQYEFAKEKAPAFTEEFETILKETKLDTKIHKLQEDMHKFYYQGDEAIFSALIGDKKSKLDALKETIFNIKYNLLNKTLVNIFDRTHGFSVAEFTMFNKLNKAEQSPTKLLRMALGGSAGTYEAVVKFGTPKLTAKGDLAFNGKGLADIFEPVLKQGSNEFKELMEYFAAVQANEMQMQNKKTPFSKSQIETILKRGEDKPLYKRVFQEYQEFNNRMLDFYVQMDYLTPTDVENFRNKNSVYVPMQRVVESMGQKDGKVSSGFFGRKGSDRNIRDIEKNITEQLFYHIRGAMIAHAKSKLFSQLDRHEDGSLFAVKIAPDTKKIKVGIEQQAKKIVEILYQSGMMLDEIGAIIEIDENVSLEEAIDNTIDVLIEQPHLMSFLTFGHKPKNTGSSIEEVIINGEKKYFEIQTGELGDILNTTLNSMGGIQYGWFMGALYAFKNFKTRAITSMPQFKLPNFVRDALDAQVFRKTKSPINPLAGAKSYFTIDDAFKNYMLNGGGYGTLIESSTTAKPDEIFKESTWQQFDRFMSFDEYSNRVAVAQDAIEEGASWFDAAYQGRDLTVDFSMVGANPILRSVLKLLPFQQAAMNGMYKLIREIKDEGHNAATYGKAVARLSIKGFTYLTPIAIVAFLMNEDDERYKALTTDEMARFVWFFYDKNEQPIKIPVPFGLGAIFQKFPEYIMSMLFSDGDFVDKRYSDAVMFAVTHQMIAVPNGGIFDPIIQDLMNKNFTGSPIVSSQLQKIEPYLQYNNRTPELYKEIGEATGLSPLRLEHYTKGTLGYIESAITGMTQMALWDKEKFGEMPYSSKEDYIHGAFFKQFYKMNETSRTAWSEEYYKYREKIEEAYSSVQFTNKQIIKDKGDSYEDYLSKNDKVLLSSLKKFTTNLDAITAQLKKAEDAIIFDKKLSADEKEKKIDEIYKQQNTMFKQVYKEINKVVEEKK